MTSSRYKWVVWWYRSDPLTGQAARVYRDFRTSTAARAFARKEKGRHYATIASCRWHIQNNPGLLGTWSKVEKL